MKCPTCGSEEVWPCDNCGDWHGEDDLAEIKEQGGKYCDECIADLHWTPKTY